MPQMMPMSWMSMYFIILFFLNLTYIILYQSSTLKISNPSSSKKYSKSQMMMW